MSRMLYLPSRVMISQIDRSASHLPYNRHEIIGSLPRNPILGVVLVIWQSMSLARAPSTSGTLISISSSVCCHVHSIPGKFALPSCMGWWVIDPTPLLTSLSYVCLSRESSESSSVSHGSSSPASASSLHWYWHLEQQYS